MELNVGSTFNWENETADADALGATLRLFQVAMLNAYAGTTAPQTNLTASLPWARAGAASVAQMSALCYYFGAELVRKHPDTPIGLLASSWGQFRRPPRAPKNHDPPKQTLTQTLPPFTP
jgi:hypothetical protein